MAKAKTIALALDLRAGLKLHRDKGFPIIVKEDIKKQDLSFMDEKLDRQKKMMKKHPGRNKAWDPETKTHQLTEFPLEALDPTISRQVRRQLERLEAKAIRTHFSKHVPKGKDGSKLMKSTERVVSWEDPDTKMLRHGIKDINRVNVTHLNTSRYVPHHGAGVRYFTYNGQMERTTV